MNTTSSPQNQKSPSIFPEPNGTIHESSTELFAKPKIPFNFPRKKKGVPCPKADCINTSIYAPFLISRLICIKHLFQPNPRNIISTFFAPLLQILFSTSRVP